MPHARIIGRLRTGSRSNRRGTPRHLSHASEHLADRWATVDDVELFYRESLDTPADPVMLHLHGFGLSGRYLVPTAARLTDDFHTLVPDLPGCGRSGNPARPPEISDLATAAVALLDTQGIERATLVGNSVGCAVICEFARLFPERIERAVLVSPAGGPFNRPLRRAVGQLARTGTREPARLLPVAVPDYLRFGVPSTLQLFRSLTQFPSVERLLALSVPTLVVLGSRDPLLPPPERIKEVAGQSENSMDLVVIEGAAHAINFSHPGELANVIRLFMADRPIVDDPDSPGQAHVFELHRGVLLPRW